MDSNDIKHVSNINTRREHVPTNQIDRITVQIKKKNLVRKELSKIKKHNIVDEYI